MDKTTASAEQYPPLSQSYYMIAVLMIVTLSSQLDRNITSLLIDPIGHDLGIDDLKMSYVHGLGFAVVYAIAGLPFGYLVDRANRKRIVLAGLLFWSAAAILCGFANSFWQLLTARLGVGVGEACLAPACYSMIADCVPGNIRGRALAVYYSSITIGQGLSLVIGGLILGALPATSHVPFVNLDLAAWRMVFIAIGLPGFLASTLLLTIREPKRIVTSLDSGTTQAKAGAGEFLRFMNARRRLFIILLLPFCLIGFVAWGTSAWAPSLIHRRFNTDLGHVGQLVGMTGLSAGLIGAYVGGYLSDLLANRDLLGSRYGICLVSAVVMAAAGAIWPFAASVGLALTGFWVAIFAAIISLSGAAAAIQDVVPNRMRGQAIAFYMLVAGIFALGLGPTIIAAATKYVFAGPQGLSTALVVVALPSLAVIGLVSLYGRHIYVQARRDIAR